MLRRKILFTLSLVVVSLWFVSACASSNTPLPTPKEVNLEKFMGAWFVHGYTPILVDKKAHNAVEHYYLNEKGRVETTYRFRDGSFDGELKTFTPKGFPDEADPANWQMQFIWPFKSDYVVIHLSEDYQSTIIGHPSRKYAWVMTRDHEITEQAYESLLDILKNADYDTSIIKRLPQDWSDVQDRLKTLKEVGASGPLAER